MGEFATQMIRSISIVERLYLLFENINPDTLSAGDEKKLYNYIVEHGGIDRFAEMKKIVGDRFIRDNILSFSKFGICKS